jgi:hypothetical protein
VHIKVPKLSADRAKLEEVAGKYNLQVSVCYFTYVVGRITLKLEG